MSSTMDTNPVEDPVASGLKETVSLLSLPIELRLQLYQYLPISTFAKKITMLEGQPESFEFSIVYKGTASPILATCRQINAEASNIMAHKMKMVIERVPGVLIDLENLPKLVSPSGPLLHIGSYLCLVSEARKHGHTFSLARIPVAQPSEIDFGPSGPPGFAIIFRKLVLIMEKRHSVSRCPDTAPLELAVGIRNSSGDHYKLASKHHDFICHLSSQHAHDVLFRYIIRPVAKAFSDTDMYIHRQLNQHFSSIRLVSGHMSLKDHSYEVLRGPPIEEGEFEEHWYA